MTRTRKASHTFSFCSHREKDVPETVQVKIFVKPECRCWKRIPQLWVFHLGFQTGEIDESHRSSALEVYRIPDETRRKKNMKLYTLEEDNGKNVQLAILSPFTKLCYSVRCMRCAIGHKSPPPKHFPVPIIHLILCSRNKIIKELESSRLFFNGQWLRNESKRKYNAWYLFAFYRHCTRNHVWLVI